MHSSKDSFGYSYIQRLDAPDERILNSFAKEISEGISKVIAARIY